MIDRDISGGVTLEGWPSLKLNWPQVFQESAQERFGHKQIRAKEYVPKKIANRIIWLKFWSYNGWILGTLVIVINYRIESQIFIWL